MNRFFRFLPPVVFAFSLSMATARDLAAASAADLDRLAPELRPGDAVILRDGIWTDQNLTLRGKGTEAKPVTFRAATPGKVILAGSSSLVIDGSHLVVVGIWLKESTTKERAVAMRGDHCRLSECAVTGGQARGFLQLFGTDHRVDHCYFADKTTEAPTVQVEVEATPNHHRFDHNHFGPRPPLGRNGGETMRIGYSGQSMRSSATLVEDNLFDRCDGEIEIISNKSCDNVYRSNTFRNCAGMLTLRHGNGCRVEGNFFFGNHKKGSGGIRVIGENHVIANNYIDAVEQGAFWITSGIPDSPLVGYFRASGCTIAFNTVVDSPGACFQLDAGIGSSGRTLLPENITLACNLICPAPDGVVARGRQGEGFRWIGNAATVEAPEFKVMDPRLGPAADGVMRPGKGSPVVGAATALKGIDRDIDGQERTGRFDVGCDQVSRSPIVHRPLAAADTGPGWMSRGVVRSRFDEVLTHDRNRILAAAERALGQEPITITRARAPLSEGGTNDFYSNGDYWWPDPAKPGGLPYIKRDGKSNPDNFCQHRLFIRDLRDAVAALAAGYLATGDERYPEQSAKLLRVFFLDPATRMNPSLTYAQAIPGVSPGRGIGIIDTLHLIEIPAAISAMEQTRPFRSGLADELRGWFREYAGWMTGSANGRDEARAPNNHSVAYELQLAVYFRFCGDEAGLARCRRRFKETFVPDQMAADGSFPAELARTKPYGYSIFQLDNMALLCQVLSTPEDDLWSFTLPDGRGMARAAGFLTPFLAEKSKWLRKPDVEAWDGWPARQPVLLFAGIACDRPDWIRLWNTLPADPAADEVRRNIAITQPVLWLPR